VQLDAVDITRSNALDLAAFNAQLDTCLLLVDVHRLDPIGLDNNGWSLSRTTGSGSTTTPEV